MIFDDARQSIIDSLAEGNKIEAALTIDDFAAEMGTRHPGTLALRTIYRTLTDGPRTISGTALRTIIYDEAPAEGYTPVARNWSVAQGVRLLRHDETGEHWAFRGASAPAGVERVELYPVESREVTIVVFDVDDVRQEVVNMRNGAAS